MDRIAVRTARLEDDDARIIIPAQSLGEDRAGGPAANDHIVKSGTVGHDVLSAAKSSKGALLSPVASPEREQVASSSSPFLHLVVDIYAVTVECAYLVAHWRAISSASAMMSEMTCAAGLISFNMP